jgi:peptidoglycan biosynthesis protein MviN/MurJ (putative lipid II flippase)
MAEFWLLWLGFSATAGLSVIATLAICVGQVRGAYVQTALVPLINSLGLVTGALAAAIFSQAWLLLAGQLIGASTAAVWSANKLRLRLWSSSRKERLVGLAALASARPHALAVTLATTAFTLFQPIDALLCVRLGGGAVTIMAYSQRVWVAIGTAVSLGAYSIAARTSYDSFQQGGRRSLRVLANSEVKRILLSGAFIWFAYVAGARTLLERVLLSSAMTKDDVQLLNECVKWMLVSVGPMTAIPYLFRVFYTIGEYRVPAIIGVLIAPAYGLLAWQLTGEFGILALPYSLSIVWWIAFTAALFCINVERKEPKLQLG